MQRWLKHRAAMKPLNDMHQALGEFLTQMGRVEFQMLLLMDFLNETPIEALFAETTGKLFGEKIKSFKAWCDLGGVSEMVIRLAAAERRWPTQLVMVLLRRAGPYRKTSGISG